MAWLETYCISVTRIDVETADGRMDCYGFTPEGLPGQSRGAEVGEGPWPPVVLYMDAFGIRPQLGEMAQRLASNGYFVVIPNLYYRSGAFAPFDPKQVVSEGPERDRFKGMIQSINNTKVMRDTAAVLAMIDIQPLARSGPLGVVGYCMGGGFALSAAGTFPDREAAAASFHGGSLATDKPMPKDADVLVTGSLTGWGAACTWESRRSTRASRQISSNGSIEHWLMAV